MPKFVVTSVPEHLVFQDNVLKDITLLHKVYLCLTASSNPSPHLHLLNKTSAMR